MGEVINPAEYLLRNITSEETFRRGEQYLRSGSVLSIVREGDLLVAEVAGSAPHPYRVELAWGQHGLINAHCDCPYSYTYGDYCKHIIACALTITRHPERIQQREPLSDRLKALSQDQLTEILTGLIRINPSIRDQVHALVTAQESETHDDSRGESGESAPALDGSLVRRRVQAAFQSLHGMRPSEAYWHVSGVVAQVEVIVQEALQLLSAGRVEDALLILADVTWEYLEGWTALDDSDGEASGFLWDIGDAWALAILMLNPSGERREDLVQRIDEYSAALMDYGLEEAFYSARDAIDQGWGTPEIQSAMNGDTVDDADLMLDPLIPYRLKVLAWQERYDEFLNLSRAAGHASSYLGMLVQLDRVDEAVQHSFALCSDASQALFLVSVLHKRGNEKQALEVGKLGLELPGPKHQLAAWVRDAAGASGDTELALRAGIVAFETMTDLESYQRVEQYAGSDWPQYRGQLLEIARHQHIINPLNPVAVFLHEGMVAEAIAIADQHPRSDSLVESVASHAVESHPDWVITQALPRADDIMDNARSSAYEQAAQWMELVKLAHLAVGRHAEWNALLDDRLERHHRKRKLRPMLEQLIE
jgi:uncharacterized Zn finger protein